MLSIQSGTVNTSFRKPPKGRDSFSVQEKSPVNVGLDKTRDGFENPEETTKGEENNLTSV